MDFLRCVVERITYTNEENGYTVLRVKAKSFSDLVTAVGNMGAVNAGAVLSLKGEWKVDSKYGRQFSVREYEETLPATVYGIEKYLGSGLIKGVGPKFAGRIVKTFGADTLQVIEETPDKLIEVPGIGGKRVGMIKKAWQEQKEIKNIMLFLQDHGIGTAFAFRIFKAFGADSIAVAKENPFKLTDIWGIGFKTADTVAQKMGFDKESFYRCRSGLLYVLNECSNDGHCFMPRDELTQKAAEMLEIEEPKLHMTIDDMLREKDLICEPPNSLYLPPLFFSESGTAKRIRALLSAQSVIPDADEIIVRAEKAAGIEYDEIQKDAIRTAASSKVMILTGGPGTGKTTTVKGILALFREAGMKTLLAAPTGRAAKRLSETTGMEAKTIHRLLEAKPPEGYQRNEDNKLEGDALIVDESSMIDIVLMYNLLRAVPDSMTVLFVGDVDQLPSVGAGNVLRDMIDSETVPVVKLTRIFRQATGSHIIMNAHRINKGQFPNLKTGKNSDFFFVEQQDSAAIPETIVSLCAKRLPKYFGIKPSSIQVLCPMQRGENGARNLNVLLQNTLNPPTAMLRRGGTEYRHGDKVMQIKNNYDKEVWNGDIGSIVSVDEEERTLAVSFDGGAPVAYDIAELDELVLAYATTVHKAQGSEYDVVVLPLTTQHYMMLQRNLLYTGVTRAKKTVVLVGTVKAVGMAVKNNSVTKRNTGLAERLKKNWTAYGTEYGRMSHVQIHSPAARHQCRRQ
jgi:exodeoxyribonuclease V alpha subunit